MAIDDPDDSRPRDTSILRPGESSRGTPPSVSEGIKAAPEVDDGPEVAIDGYIKLREITRGGQAIVFSAVQQSTGRRVAIKLIKERPFEQSIEKSRLDREVRILAALDHPHIVSVIDRGTTRDGFLYFVLNYVDGQTLTKFMEEYRRSHKPEETIKDPTELLRLFMEICDAVNAAHLRGIVHRDMKPSNIIVDNQGEPHILDFGLARTSMPLQSTDEDLNPMTMTGQFIGSLQWASPEQAEGIPAKIDTRTDVYSLGVILYQMLTGDFPYQVNGTLKEVLDNILLVQPKPPSEVIEAAFSKQGSKSFWRGRAPAMQAADRIVLKALAKKREDRYQTAGELARDVQAALSGKAVKAAHTHTPAAPWKTPAIIALSVAVGIGLAALYARWQGLETVTPHPASGLPALPGDAPVSKRSLNVVGYRIDGGDVVFEFIPKLYGTVRLENGVLSTISALTNIQMVSVVGDFNEWLPLQADWTLKLAEPGRYELRKSLASFGTRAQWPFKYVVNRAVWVSAPISAINRVVVPMDTASYNLIFDNPLGIPDTNEKVVRIYREQIESAWPGQGANLAPMGMGDQRYFFTLTTRGPQTKPVELTPLEGIPLGGLNIFDALVKDFSPLQGMTMLDRLVGSDASLKAFLAPVHEALARDEFDRAEALSADLLAKYMRVPAFAEFSSMLQESISAMKALHAQPGQIPIVARGYGNHQYVLVLRPMSWIEASDYCRKHGAYLATITTAEEQEWVGRTFSVASLGFSFWLGGSDAESEGNWAWNTGEIWWFQSWGGGEPDNHGGSENHLLMKTDGWWYDGNGSNDKNPFLMEWGS